MYMYYIINDIEWLPDLPKAKHLAVYIEISNNKQIFDNDYRVIQCEMAVQTVDPDKFERLLNKISNSGQLNKFVKTIETAESQLISDLDKFVESRNHAQESKRLELSRIELSSTLTSSSNLVDVVSNAGSLASKISARVKFLDTERSIVKDTTEYVRNVKDLKSLILATNASLEQRNWESASESISKILKLPIEGEFIDIVVPSTDVPDSPKTTVEKWIDELTIFFTNEFNKAADNKDVKTLTRFFALFPKIGKNSIGIDCYSKFICNIISTQSRTIMIQNSQQDKIGFYPAALMKLLEIVSTMLNQHSKIIQEYYGLNEMSGILETVEREVDSQAGLITDTFYDERKIARTLDEIQSYKFRIYNNINQQLGPSSSTTSTAPNSTRNSPSPRGSTELDSQQRNFNSIDDIASLSVIEVSNLISEFSSILNYWSMYCRFIAIKWNEYNHIEQQKELKLPKPLLESLFIKKIQSKFLPSFEILIIFFIKKSIEQAYLTEELPDLNPILKSPKVVEPENPPVSSIIEDLFLVINSSINQLILTGQPICVKNIANSLKKIFDNDFFQIIIKRLNSSQPKYGSILNIIQKEDSNKLGSNQVQSNNTVVSNFLSRGASAINQITSNNDDIKFHWFLVYLNSLSVGKSYFDKIVSKNIESLNLNFQFGNDSNKLKEIIENLNKYYQSKSDEIVEENLTNLFNQVIKNKLKILLTDCFKESNYLISFYNDEENNEFNRKFNQRWSNLIKSYYKILDKSLFNKFIEIIILTLSNLLEKKLWSLNGLINELGSIKLEKEFSGIIMEVTKYRYNLRDKFLRVTQIIMILGFDDEDDEIEMNWILTATERQKARNLRVDRK